MVFLFIWYLGSVRKNPLSKDSSDKEIEQTIMKWLRGAPDRLGGKRAGENQNQNK
jgi:hypothetical protein